MSKSQHDKLEELLKSFAEEARHKLNKALLTSAVPDEYLENTPDSFLLAKAVMDSVCRDRPFRPTSPKRKTEFDNLHICI